MYIIEAVLQHHRDEDKALTDFTSQAKEVLKNSTRNTSWRSCRYWHYSIYYRSIVFSICNMIYNGFMQWSGEDVLMCFWFSFLWLLNFDKSYSRIYTWNLQDYSKYRLVQMWTATGVPSKYWSSCCSKLINIFKRSEYSE